MLHLTEVVGAAEESQKKSGNIIAKKAWMPTLRRLTSIHISADILGKGTCIVTGLVSSMSRSPEYRSWVTVLGLR